MNTKVLMTTSAVLMISVGVTLTFLPLEVSELLGSPGTGVTPIVLQVMGALYFGWGMVNWTAKANLIGGIYGRPVAIGNLSHFMIGALALMKGYSSNSSGLMLTAMIVYIVFAIAFGYVFFTHPVSKTA